MKVVIPQDITDAGKDYLKEKGYEIVIGTGDTDIEAMKKQVEGADGILARTAPYPAEVLAAAKNLKVIGRHGLVHQTTSMSTGAPSTACTSPLLLPPMPSLSLSTPWV